MSIDRTSHDRDLKCHCVWRGERCSNQATAEDMLCNWCVTAGKPDGRSDSTLLADPKAIISPDGEFMGIGGEGQLHDKDESKPASTAACWYPDSDRVVA